MGRFVVFEGGEASGKSTQARLLAERWGADLTFEPGDTEANAAKLLHKLLNYRVFSDEEGKMNLSLADINGGLLLVSQFTLAADTKSGLRPSFSTAAPPALAEALFNHLLSEAARLHPTVESGRFGADMQVHLVNDGPVTFLLST